MSYFGVEGVDEYFAFEKEVAKASVLPYLKEAGITVEGKKVLDIGCSEGGLLSLLLSEKPASLTGVELDTKKAEKAQKRFENEKTVTILHDDIAKRDFEEHFDMIHSHDVLEHVEDPEKLIQLCYRFLAPGGILFVAANSFASPFGGHQMHGSNLFRLFPWLHLFMGSESLIRLIKPESSLYMTKEAYIGEIETIYKGKLSISKLETSALKAGFSFMRKDLYLIRPEYQLRYGLPVVKVNFLWSVPFVRDLLPTGFFTLLKKS